MPGPGGPGHGEGAAQHLGAGWPAPAAHPRRRPRPQRVLSLAWVAPLVVVALVAGLVGGVVGSRTWGEDRRPATADLPPAPSAAAPVQRDPASIAGIAAGVLPSVVSIEVESAEGSGSGSGFVLREDGYVLTNNHVVAGAGEGGLVVVFADGTELPGSVVGATSEYDLAVVKVEATGLTPLTLGDSDAVVVGDPVVAVGAPLGLVGTVTTGIVSARNRPVVAGEGTDQTFINAIQTDAAINPGNSGGPLVDAAGRVVGINSAIAQLPGGLGAAGGSIGLGFAIPSNQARRTAEQLITTGRATYPVIGVLLDEAYTGEGVRVRGEDVQGRPSVTPDGPADRAGIRRGDVILTIDGRPVTTSEELIVAIRARQAGDTVELRVRTDGRERDVRVRLDELPSD
ncbi:S1C family serine protease [Cellulomonas sp. JZ18]|uniref:S1C family serine protease n=1 Tax=Cellulomonas sp. JZ18 TaxID=2654191 RepID=UPI001E61A236|nr:trypsin-like peptidase domain-containing protein [Cellulomonas sp. JZ18]